MQSQFVLLQEVLLDEAIKLLGAEPVREADWFSVTAIDPQFYCCSVLRFRPSILHKLKLQTHVQPRAVVEAAELWIDHVLLHVAWVEMVRQVEKCDAGATVILLALEL